MALDILYVSILLIIFTIILWIITGFLFIETSRAEKIARPFLTSLMVYFFLMSMCNLAQAIAFLNGDYPVGDDSVYNNYISLLFIYSAPIYLISQVEKNYFQQFKPIAKYHIFSLTALILFIIFVLVTVIQGITDPSVFSGFSMLDYAFILYPLWAMNNFIILFAFMYLAIKTTEKYRMYSLLICVGWTLNQIFNTVLQLPFFERTNTLLTIVFLFKYIGAIITALYLYKLYNLK